MKIASSFPLENTNSAKVKTLSLLKGSGYSDWKTINENIALKAGENKIELKANAARRSPVNPG